MGTVLNGVRFVLGREYFTNTQNLWLWFARGGLQMGEMLK